MESSRNSVSSEFRNFITEEVIPDVTMPDLQFGKWDNFWSIIKASVVISESRKDVNNWNTFSPRDGISTLNIMRAKIFSIIQMEGKRISKYQGNGLSTDICNLLSLIHIFNYNKRNFKFCYPHNLLEVFIS